MFSVYVFLEIKVQSFIIADDKEQENKKCPKLPTCPEVTSADNR